MIPVQRKTKGYSSSDWHPGSNGIRSLWDGIPIPKTLFSETKPKKYKLT